MEKPPINPEIECATVGAFKPPPHAKYIVRRGVFYFTATPCYGMHTPRWVVKLMEKGDEAEPVPMEDADVWWTLEGFEKRFIK